MALDLAATTNAIRTAASKTALDAILMHEPKAAPNSGITLACWFQRLIPSQRNSGIDVTSVAAVWSLRLHKNMLSEPQDEIDADLLLAAGNLYAALHADLDLGATVESIDVLGIEGTRMVMDAGYVDIGNTKYRCMTITLPVILADVWTQES